MKKIEITVNKKNDESYYLEEIKTELERLGTFSEAWKKKDAYVIYYDGGFANDEMFIRLGGVQKALLGIAYFQQGYGDITGLSLCLYADKTWKDVLDALREIESIDI